MSSFFLYLGVIVVASVVVWRGGGMLEKAADQLSLHYHLSPTLKGSVVMAIGSSFPELSTTVISTLLHGEFDLGVSTIIGSAIFNILVIPGLSAVMARGMESRWMLVVKDVQFYITSIIVLLLSFALAALYYPQEGAAVQGKVTRGIALLPACYYGLYLFLQQTENKTYQRENKGDGVENDIRVGKAWGQFVLSLILIVLSVEGLVRSALFMGDYFNTPNFFWGAVVLAAATSVPDAVVSVRTAINKEGISSLANVVGSNIFDLLIAVPAGVLIAGSAVVNFSAALPMTVFLALSTVVLVFLLLTKEKLSRSEGYVLITIYFIFVIWMALESQGIMHFIP